MSTDNKRTIIILWVWAFGKAKRRQQLAASQHQARYPPEFQRHTNELTNHSCWRLPFCDKVRFLRRVPRRRKPYSGLKLGSDQIQPRGENTTLPIYVHWEPPCGLLQPGIKITAGQSWDQLNFFDCHSPHHVNLAFFGVYKHKLHNFFLTPHSGITLMTWDPNHPHDPAVWCEHGLRHNQRWFAAVFQHHRQLPAPQCWVRSSP